MPFAKIPLTRIARILSLSVMPITAWMLAGPAIAQDNSEPITLTDGAAQVQGVSAADYSLTLLAGRDRRRRLCLGYGATQPSHTLVLSEPYPRLQIAVDSGGGDTTLLVQGPNGIDCNDNPGRNQRDAVVTDTDWPEGTYRIWVGSFNEGDRLNYTLEVSESAPSNDSR